ncbi:MAG: TonB-dependent receptor [Planctomycetota bacterium]|nr:TonB-dependent receptor [Planctomycetota bacterium]
MLLLAGLGRAEEAPAKPRKPRGDELLVFENLPQVVSASRQKQPASRSSVPVSVLTAEDIHYSGLTSIPELLQFVPGVDVLPVDRMRAAVGVHGLHDVFSDRTLTLINGRGAESPVFGGAEWYRYPLFMEDIERIEVVRGPGGAAWGANAFNGVINVITKQPEDTLGVLASSTVNEYGDSASHVRWGARNGKWTWRTSFGYEEVQSSEDAIHHDRFRSNDYRTAGAFSGVANYKVAEGTKVAFGLGHQHQKNGSFEFEGLEIHADGSQETTRAHVRAEHKVNEKLSGYVQWSGNFEKTDNPSLQRSLTSVNDLEAQAEIKVAPRHKLAVGASARWMAIDTRVKRASDIRFPGTPLDEYFAGAFGVYNWEIADRLALEVQARGDWYSETHADWSSRVALIYDLDEARRHTLRFAGSRAYRTPFVGLRRYQVQRLEVPEIPGLIPPGTFLVNNLPNHDLDNEGVCSLEFGYTARPAKGVTVRWDNYYQRYHDLIGFVATDKTFLPAIGFTQFTYQSKNTGGAVAYGSELEVAYANKLGRVSAWAAFNAFESEFTAQEVRAFHPAPFKAGASGRAFLPHEVVLNANYRYSSVTAGDFAQDFVGAQVFHRLDFSVSRRFGKHAELTIGINDLLNKTRDPVQAMGAFTDHEAVGRTFFGRFQLKF